MKKSHNKELSTFVTKFYLFKLFSVMGFIIPFVAILFDENGLNATQIAIVMIAMRVVQLVTEIPSGTIADKYSRKYVIAASQVFTVLLYVCWLFFPNFWGYFIGYAFCGLGISLSSGCIEAFVYDELNKHKRRDLFERVQGRGGTMVAVGVLIASAVASILVKIGYNYDFLLILTIITTSISILVILTIKPAKKVKDIEEEEGVLSYMETLKKGVKYSFSHKIVLKLTLFLAFSNFINVGILEYSEIFYNEITNSLAKVAILFGIMEIAYAFGNFIAEYFKKVKIKTMIVVYFIFSVFDIIAYHIYSYPVSFIILTLDTLVICSIYINFIGRKNDLIPSRIRATVLSVRGFIESIGTFATLIAFGLVVDHFHLYKAGFLTFSYIYAIGSLVFLVFFLKDKEIE